MVNFSDATPFNIRVIIPGSFWEERPQKQVTWRQTSAEEGTCLLSPSRSFAIRQAASKKHTGGRSLLRLDICKLSLVVRLSLVSLRLLCTCDQSAADRCSLLRKILQVHSSSQSWLRIIKVCGENTNIVKPKDLVKCRNQIKFWLFTLSWQDFN